MASFPLPIAEPVKADRTALVQTFEQRILEGDAKIRDLVINKNRIDVLAVEVLGFELQKFHKAMAKFELSHKHSMHLVFRGAGKSTILSTTFVLLRLLQQPNVRILIASKTSNHAEAVLREVKQHIVDNEKFRRIFGDLVGDKWTDREITLNTRTKSIREPSVMCIGVGGQVVGKHFDIGVGDDLVDEENARTELGRDKLKTWYYKSLIPTMEPHAELHIIGTRYHPTDLYGHLLDNEMKNHTHIIPALDEYGRSPWPEKFSPEFFQQLKSSMGSMIFNSQMQCDAESMRGEIFNYDWMQLVEASQVPDEGRIFVGIDLAISQKDEADRFAMVAVKVTKDLKIYIIASYTERLTFTKQTKKIIEWWETGVEGRTSPPSESDSQLIEMGIETNAYQDAQYQKLNEEKLDIRLHPIKTLTDKRTRAMKLSSMFENKRVFIVKGQPDIVDQLVMWGKYKDLFDALDLAVSTAFRSRRKRRDRNKVGII